jgi:hypothetical protein
MTVQGLWRITVQTPKGDVAWDLAIEPAGEGFGGTLTMAAGSVAIEEGKAEGARLTWVSNLEKPRRAKLKGKATVDGDQITGEIKMGMFGRRPFTGVRV